MDETLTTAINLFPEKYRQILYDYCKDIALDIYEIRVAVCKEISLYGKFGVKKITLRNKENNFTVSKEDIEEIFNKICFYSVYAYQDQINRGFITYKGLLRIGLCGTANTEKGKIISVKDISFLNIRLLREFSIDCSRIFDTYNPLSESIIIAGSPCSGKTTLLRSVIKAVSNGVYSPCMKTIVCDERNEICSVIDGIPQKDVGDNTFILTQYPMNDAVDIAVRTLSPDIIALDEISLDSETESIKRGVNSGVRFIVTVHAQSKNELFHRVQIKKLLETYSFSKIIVLYGTEKPAEIKEIINAKEILGEIHNRHTSCNSIYENRYQ